MSLVGKKIIGKQMLRLVGVARFELTAPASRTQMPGVVGLFSLPFVTAGNCRVPLVFTYIRGQSGDGAND